MTIFLASGNAHKKMEMQALFPDITLKTPLDAGIEFTPDEMGDSFVENALIKALALHQLVKVPVIADDSGLCIDALGGVPGIYSARYAGNASQYEKNRLLLAETNAAIAEAETRSENPHSLSSPNLRACRFVCAMVLLLSPDRFFVAQETMEGCLVSTIDEAKGNNGFGYDPIVIPDGYSKTVAELSEDEKNRISHRGKAARVLLAVLLKSCI
jgi:XTP/dITP diphosphohydrolase